MATNPFSRSERPPTVTQRSSARYRHWPFGCCSEPPSYRVSENDIVEVRRKSRDMTPFVVAQAEAGERQVPAWLEVVPDQMRVLVHALPVRAQIDTQVQEQLIVELYSK